MVRVGDSLGRPIVRALDDAPANLRPLRGVLDGMSTKKRGDRDGVNDVDRFDSPKRDPSREPNLTHKGRDRGGRYNGDGNRPWDDKQALGVENYARINKVEVITTEVRVDFPGSPQNGRTYDGLIRNSDGPNTYDGLEVKSGDAAARYYSEAPSNTQGAFDRTVLAGTPARGKMDGVEILVTKVVVREEL